jgi:predicted cupin superfamily sugar epimerase
LETDGKPTAAEVIAALGLQPHPEGGWYREIWRADAPSGQRAGGTTILFLLEGGKGSHWHRVDAEEHWFWHAGAPLTLSIATDTAVTARIIMGAAILIGQNLQANVPTNHWQAARSEGDWSLVSCAVVPGFEFAGFTLAPPNWEPGDPL